jgi:hypothetical protein
MRTAPAALAFLVPGVFVWLTSAALPPRMIAFAPIVSIRSVARSAAAL